MKSYIGCNLMFYIMCISTVLISIFSSFHVRAASPWYSSTVVEVTTQKDGVLFIRTASNPNPKSCASSWAGAVFNSSNIEAVQLAASIALMAKVSGANIRFQIDNENCALNGGWPSMLWIQLQ